MSCLICGEAKTVRSHIVPKAIVASIADDNKVVMGSRFHQGAKTMQRGQFNDTLLCAQHEGITSGLDKYGVEFIRRADAIFDAEGGGQSFQVSNPKPRQLSKFALSIIWREVEHSLGPAKRTLGPYAGPVRDAVFGSGDLDWPLLIQRQKIVVGDGERIRMIVHPYTLRLMQLNAWCFALAGYAFFAICDRRGIKNLPGWLRANEADPATIIVGDELPIGAIGSLRPILRNMAAKSDPRS